MYDWAHRIHCPSWDDPGYPMCGSASATTNVNDTQPIARSMDEFTKLSYRSTDRCWECVSIMEV